MRAISWEQFAAFHQEMVETNELDPVYPVLKEMGRLLNLSKEDLTWLVHVYVAYYDMGSALNCFEENPQPRVPSNPTLSRFCATERRGHRDPYRFKPHFESLVSISENNGGLYAWITKYLTGDPERSWKAIQAPLEVIYGNGRWAAYKVAEMLQKVIDLPIQAPDMGHANSTGPRDGLAYLYSDLPTGNKALDIATLDAYSQDLLQKVAAQGASAKIEEVETSLCGLKSLINGHYYIGADIDKMQESLDKQPCSLTPIAYQARANVFPHRYLGELNGWSGIDKERLKAYKQTGAILTR